MGDTSYQLVASGSTTASAATAHRLLGTYNGLSAMNQGATMILKVLPITNSLEVLSSSVLSIGYLVSTSQIGYSDLPAMRVSDIDGLHFRNSTAANASVRWSIWNRVP